MIWIWISIFSFDVAVIGKVTWCEIVSFDVYHASDFYFFGDVSGTWIWTSNDVVMNDLCFVIYSF